MNFVFISPHFPPNYYPFCVQLHNLGVNVLGVADEPHEHLRPELKSALSEYYRVPDMNNYDQMLRALGYFTGRYGKIDRIDSHNEYWLETEAKLRTDFNVFGIKENDILWIKRKSLMKKLFQQANVRVARGKVINTLGEAKRFIKAVGYPVVAKPDIGVGAARTYKIHDPIELQQFFERKPAVEYIFEEFIQGQICSFDGLTDRDGNPVFFTSHVFSQGIMEVVNKDEDIYYYSLRDIPDDLECAGRKVLKAFNVRERFFHLEFFRLSEDDQLVALEVNIRPPGGLTTDMFNFANDIDIYHEWANVVLFNKFTAQYSRKYHCCYIGRKSHHHYLHSHTEVLEAFGKEFISYHEAISGVFSAALGDYGYVVRSPELDDIFEMVDFIQGRAYRED